MNFKTDSDKKKNAYSIRSLSSKQLPDAVFVELVDLIFRPVLPAVVIGVSVLCVGTLIALRKGDIAAFALTIGGVFISVARISLIVAYRRRTAGSPLNVAEARVWERRYAVASVALAALIGALNARGLMMGHSINPMLIPMMVTGLIFGYGAGIVTRIAVRPAICVTSLMVATIPTVIGFCARAASADGLYASAVFSVQTLLIAGFAIASLESVLDIYKTTCQQLISKLDLAILARQDDLTGLPNRVQLRERFNEAGSRIRQTDDLLALHCLDLDHFKAVNDTFGHPMGDLLLKAVTRRLRQVIREGDTVARVGGDEFAILQTGIRHVDEAQLLALRIIRVLGAPFNLDGHEICIGVSIGIALAPRDGLNLEHLISCADDALYESKRTGRGNVIFWRDRFLTASPTAA